jgi:fructosamine-3-kinase
MSESAALPTDVLTVFERITGRRGHELVWLSESMAGRTAEIRCGSDRFFAKWADTRSGRRALAAEARGLALLSDACPGHVPAVYGSGADGEDEAATEERSLLVMDFIERGAKPSDHAEQLASVLDAVHGRMSDAYGFAEDNFIGATPQSNTRHSAWPDFFRQERLMRLRRRLVDVGRWRGAWSEPFDRLIAALDDLLPEKPDASLLHGDLWSGNVMTAADGRAMLIDPAVYYGHFETDLAMMRLFGGFQDRVFEWYAERRAPEPGFEDRIPIYNLYHLLNHVLLFGAGYHADVERTLRTFA